MLQQGTNRVKMGSENLHAIMSRHICIHTSLNANQKRHQQAQYLDWSHFMLCTADNECDRVRKKLPLIRPPISLSVSQ